jgi:Xaa-Pro dipeptidase
VSHDGILKVITEWLDVPPLIFTGNPLIIKPGMVFFMHMILMDSEVQLAMNLGETYLVTETDNERLGNQKLDLVVL